MMPKELILIRHGESEGNLAFKASGTGDDRYITEQFLAQHSSRWRLTANGRQQAQQTGQWLKEQYPDGFDRLYVSEYDRALETAALLDLPNASWRISPYLRERNWGDVLDRISRTERDRLYKQTLVDKETTPYYWRPPSGESLADVCHRLRNILDTLHRECSEGRTLLVCHGEVMEAFRIELERMSEMQYIEWKAKQQTDASEKIRNCQVWQYSRQAPDAPQLMPHLSWRRSCLPWQDYQGPWQEISRNQYSNEQLLQIVQQHPPLFDE